MDMDEAIRVATPPAIPLDEVGQRLVEQHGTDPQKEALVRRAIATIREGLGHLASLGHMFHLSEMPPDPPLKFPQMLYKVSPGMGPLTMTVENSEDLESALKDGWSETPGAPVPPVLQAEVPPPPPSEEPPPPEPEPYTEVPPQEEPPMESFPPQEPQEEHQS